MSENAARINAERRRAIVTLPKDLSRTRPVLLAGPTASGKSALAMQIASALGGPIINADALQVFADWRVLTARPGAADEAELPHKLYGHVPGNQTYSVGQWLRDLTPLLDGPPPVIVGGTGLYFMALTEGLADIPGTPAEVRSEAMARIQAHGFGSLLSELDARTAARIDRNNPMRVQRAWEVLTTTGRGLADWQDSTPPPLIAADQVTRLLIDAPKHWLTPRIEQRFDLMLDQGALDEARRNAPTWNPTLPSAKAIGAAELIAHVNGELPIEAAREAAIIATRQYAKRQRSWFRARMKDWTILSAGAGCTR